MFVARVPGRLNDRRTPLGELNWIFTAITDTIAWNTIPQGKCVSPAHIPLADNLLFLCRLVSEVVSAGFACGQSVQELLVGRAHHALL